MYLEVLSAEITKRGYGAIMDLVIRPDGGDPREATVWWEQKMLSRGHEMVALDPSSVWEEILPPVVYENDGFRDEAEGFTDDPVVLSLTREYLRLSEQDPVPLGPLPIPTRESLE